MGWKYRQRIRIRIYERNNQWSETGRMKRRKIKNLQDRETERDNEKHKKNKNKQTEENKEKKNQI